MKSSCVNAIILSEDKSKVLLIKRRDVPLWVLPGGAIEKNESPEEAAIREVLEETGCEVSISRKSAIYHPVNRLSETTHVFICKVIKGSPQTGDETRDISYFPLASMPKKFFHIHEGWLHDALNNNEKIIEKQLTQINYFTLFKYFLRHPLRVIRFLFSKLGFPINS